MSPGVYKATIRFLSGIVWRRYDRYVELRDPVENPQIMEGNYVQKCTSDPCFYAVKRPIYRALQ